MKKRRRAGFVTRKKVGQAVSLLLVLGLVTNIAMPAQAGAIKVRSIDASSIASSERYTKNFDKCDVSYDEKEETISFVGTSAYSDGDKALLDNVSLTTEACEDSDNVSIVQDEEENQYDEDEIMDIVMQEGVSDADIFDSGIYDDAEMNYECTFDMNDLVFCFNAELVDDDGNVIDTQEIVTEAIITENGGLDACIEIGGEQYMLSDYENTSSIDNCSISRIIKIIIAYLIVAETAEQIKARKNYKYNKQLEDDGKGVGRGYYVYSQSNTTTKNRKAGNYRFGFTTFGNVGCEVASAYNIALALHDTERLSETIFYFEAWAIEFSVGWGHLGSDPLEIHRYLKKRGFSYSMYTNFSKFSTAVSKKSSCKIIMSRWNSKKTQGLHTFYVDKVADKEFYGYNWSYGKYTVDRSQKQLSLSEFNDGSGFIVGYIVWK